jgi:replicative DNA helicase
VDVERQLISKMVASQQVEKLMGDGVEPTHFEKPEHQKIWTYCADHAKKYGTPPSAAMVKHEFPDYGFDVVTDSLQALFDQFVVQVKRREAISEGRQLMKAIDDPSMVGRIEEIWAESARRLMQVVPGATASRYSDMAKRIQLYKEMLKTGEVPGIPMGIPAFDNRTFGQQPHEMATIAGWQGTGKTTLGLFNMRNAYVHKQKTPLIISLEMEADALFRKFDVMETNFDYHAMKALKLDDKALERWEKAAARARDAKNDIIVLDDMRKCTVDTVYAAMVRYSPDIVLVDYISLMEAPKHASGSMWEKITHITGGLKQAARGLKIPIVAIAQTNKESFESGADLSNISYSRSIGQDSDLVFGLHQTPDMRENKQMEVRMLKNRDGGKCTALMRWEMDTMSFREWNPGDSFGPPST